MSAIANGRLAPSEYLKWKGDFTLERFRAKLANKNNLHPDVAPGYDEVFRSDLGARTIVRREVPSTNGLLRSTSSPTLTPFYDSRYSSFNRTDISLPKSTLGGSMTGSSSHDFSHLKNLPTLDRTTSVPTVGLRREESMPLRIGRAVSNSALRGGGASPTSPSAEDKKERERELQAEAASRKLWSATHGCELYMKSYSESRKNEPDNPEHKMSKCPVPMMQQALSEKANMNWRNPEWDGATLLLKAVRTGTNVLTEYLLLADKGADPSVVDDSGRGIFHWAAMSGDAAQFQLLIENVPLETRPPINGLDSGGDTPLHLAAYYGHLTIVRQLIHIKADPKMENRAGNSPVELAEIRRMWHVVSYLTESKQQKEDEECDPADFKIENLARPCNMVRKNGLAEVAKLNPKPKPKAKAKK